MVGCGTLKSLAAKVSSPGVMSAHSQGGSMLLCPVGLPFLLQVDSGSTWVSALLLTVLAPR